MIVKKIVSIALLSLPIVSFAADLTLVNNTNKDSTCVINDGACSTILGSSGVTKAHSTNVVSSTKVGMACWFNSKDCKADVYMSDNCSGPIVATVTLDTDKGIKKVEMRDNSYSIEGSGFKVTMNGGPEAK